METPEQYVKKSVQRKQLRNQTDVICFNCWQVNAVRETLQKPRVTVKTCNLKRKNDRKKYFLDTIMLDPPFKQHGKPLAKYSPFLVAIIVPNTILGMIFPSFMWKIR